MNANERERVVVSVGGSLIVPDQVDTQFLSNFREFILKKVQEGFSFHIVTGGGKTARRYQEAARTAYPNITRDSLDWIGVAGTRINAELVRGLLDAPLFAQGSDMSDTRAPVLVMGGTRIGNSSDLATVEVAKAIGARRLVNLSNIDHVYTADPKKEKDAKKIEKISWAEFRKIIPEKWGPGLNSPFDPVAAKEAEALGLEVAVINGARLEEFSNYLDGKPFVGTTIAT